MATEQSIPGTPGFCPVLGADDPYLDKGALAAFLTAAGITTTPRTALRLMAEPGFPPVLKRGKAWYVRRSLVVAWLRTQEARP